MVHHIQLPNGEFFLSDDLVQQIQDKQDKHSEDVEALTGTLFGIPIIMEPTYPNAHFAKTSIAATAILSTSPIFKSIVDKELEKVPEDCWERCQCVAAEAWQTEMIASAFSAVLEVEPSARPKRHEQLKQLKAERNRIVSHCQAVGILPTGLAWFVIRWFVLPFVFEILKKWAIGGDDDDSRDAKDDGR